MTAENTGQDLNDMLVNAGPHRVADLIESADNFLDAPPGESSSQAASEGQAVQSASPRSWGFGVQEINRNYAYDHRSRHLKPATSALRRT